MYYRVPLEPPPPDAQAAGRLRWISSEHPSRRWGRTFVLVIWRGKSQRPERNMYRTEQARANHLAELVRNDQESAAYQAERRAQRKAEAAEMAKRLTVGTILHYSWGYEQTQCDYFQVTERRGKVSVVIRPIGCEDVSASGPMSARCRPCPDEFVGPPIVKRVTANGVSMDHGSAMPTSRDSTHYRSWYH